MTNQINGGGTGSPPLFLTTDELERTYNRFESDRPKLAAAFVPRRYQTPNGYGNPKFYGMFCAMIADTHKFRFPDEKEGKSKQCDMLCIAYHVEHRWPTYFVGEDLAEAVYATKMPSGIQAGDIKPVLPSMVLCLPRAFAKRLTGFDHPWIGFSVVPRGVDIRTCFGLGHIHITDPEKYVPGQDFWIVAAPRICPDGMAMFNQWFPHDMALADKSDWTFVDDTTGGLLPSDPDLDRRAIDALTNWLVKLLLVLNSRPTLIEAGQCDRKERVKHGKVRPALYSPNWLGKSYRIKGKPLGGHHASPIAHMRIGHLHTFRHGKGRTLTKIQWVEATWVNLPENQNEKGNET